MLRKRSPGRREELFPCDIAIFLRDKDYAPPELIKSRDEAHKLVSSCLPLHLLPERLIAHVLDNVLCVGRSHKVETEECNTPCVCKLNLIEELRNTITATGKVWTKLPGKASNLLYTTKSEEMISGGVKEGPVIEAMAGPSTTGAINSGSAPLGQRR